MENLEPLSMILERYNFLSITESNSSFIGPYCSVPYRTRAFNGEHRIFSARTVALKRSSAKATIQISRNTTLPQDQSV